jgi:NADH dehydrogenase FAD-containing subunit/uncharacterized membrane protein YphA (DoxX/SURF4 family)
MAGDDARTDQRRPRTAASAKVAPPHRVVSHRPVGWLDGCLAFASPLTRTIGWLRRLVASLGRTFAPVLDVLTRLWLAQVFLRADIMQHMVPIGPSGTHGGMLLSGLTASGLGIAVQTVCPLLLAIGLFTRLAALALLLQLLVLQVPGEHDIALFWAALLGWTVVMGPGQFSLDRIFQSGVDAIALPLIGPLAYAFVAITNRIGPVYHTALRLWIAAAPVGLALAKLGISNPMAPGSEVPAWLPRVPDMIATLSPLLAFVLAVALAVGLFTRAAAVLLILLVPISHVIPPGDDRLYWLLLLGVPLLYGPGPISLDHAFVRAWRRRIAQLNMPRCPVMRLPQIVVVGGGFGGTAAARALRNASCQVTLVDQHNYHLFQPLLYQVATAGLSPADIATPIREIFRDQPNVRVLLGEVTGVNAPAREVMLGEARLSYDYLVLATGARHSYFGRDDWAPFAPGLKGIEDALDIRSRILLAFEQAEDSADEATRRGWLSFVIVGGGPTGVELAGAVAELARHGLSREFRAIDPATARIILVQSAPRLLPNFPPSLSAAAERALAMLGVEVLVDSKVEAVDQNGAIIAGKRIAARSVVWAAGVAASPAAKWLGVDSDGLGRLKVEPDLSVPGWPEIFAIGDTVISNAWNGRSVPGLAPAAKQGGAYVARVIRSALAGHPAPAPFRYRHLGSLATIGRQSAVAEFGRLRIHGAFAWWLWGAAHVAFLVGARNRLTVLVEWLWAYFTFRRSTRLITGARKA